MRPKTKQFADKLLSDPKTNATQAYLDTHVTTNRKSAKVNASQLLRQDNVLQYLGTKSDIAEKTLYSVLNNSKKHKESVNWQRLAKDSANDILDRVHGKPLTKTNSVNLNLNLEQAVNELI